MDKQQSSRDSFFGETNPWSKNDHSIWLASTLKITRNIEKFKFSGKLSTERRKQVISLVSKELLESPLISGATFGRAEEMTPIQKEYLAEHFLTGESYHQAQAGEAFIWDEKGEFLGILNLHDHFSLLWMDMREELEQTWDKLSQLESYLGKGISFAFLPKFGFLTSDSTSCGTALIAHVFLHLPALIFTRRLEEAMEKHGEDGIRQTGIQGSPEELAGDLVVLCNNYTLGVTEETIISSLRNLATKLILEEKSMRAQLKQEQHPQSNQLKDIISRAYAILLYSYQIDSLEAMQALSALKIGYDLGWVSGLDHANLNFLLFKSRRAHLLGYYGEHIPPEQLSQKRAEFIHQALKKTTLLI